MSSKDYVLQKISTTEVETEPWRHLVIDDFIPEWLYDGIKDEVSVYQETMIEKNSDRGYVTLVNKSTNITTNQNETPHLYEYYKILNDVDIELAIKDKVNIKHYHTRNLAKDMWSSFDIQTSGFVYDVHSDHESKMHTLVHYLAENMDDTSLGTSLYSPDVDTFGGIYFGKIKPLDSVKDYLKRVKYKPNSAVLFSPCTKMGYITNHAMFNLSKKTKYRKTLQTFWLKQKEDWSNLNWSATNLKK